MKLIITIIVIAIAAPVLAQQNGDAAMNDQIALARQYLSGVGRPKDEAKALEIFTACAEKGSVNAMNSLGIIYKVGAGVTANRNTAIEWFRKAAEGGYPQAWYNLGMEFKNPATAPERDYAKAYTYFSKGAELKDGMSEYAQGYMLYKGFGCIQNYERAAALFYKGARAGIPNSMYFLGLALRNGYGVPVNTDSARYWLDRAVQKGYHMAMNELTAKDPENSNTQAAQLAEKLKSLQATTGSDLNQYKKVEHSVSASSIEGVYTGHLIRYDWSGKYAIGHSTLKVEIVSRNGKLTGRWIENDSSAVALQAWLTPAFMMFDNQMEIGKLDHYNRVIPVAYTFQNAKLQWVEKGDSIYLVGNVAMFSVRRNEPEKPLFIALSKIKGNNSSRSAITLLKEDGTALDPAHSLHAFPNPFSQVITVEFDLKKDARVETQLLTLDGKVVYTNLAGPLKAGHYLLKIMPPGLITAGTYVVQLKLGNEIRTVKVIKQ